MTLSAEQIKRHAYSILRKYGLSAEEYELLLKAQGGVCAICGRPPEEVGTGRVKHLAVDHDHAKGGVIRGLLCSYCNYRILKSSTSKPDLLRAAADYLEHPPAVTVLGARQVPPKRVRRRCK